MIDQKQVIQLIGNWGYTPTQFKSYLDKQLQRAKDIGEAVGGTMYSSLLTLSKYALSGDANSSVHVDKSNADNPTLHELMSEEDIMDVINNEDFPIEVITAVYEECIEYGNLEDAELHMREKVMLTVAPILSKKIVELGSNTAEQVLQCFIGVDHNMQYKDETDTSSEVSKNLHSLAKRLSQFSKEINACKNTPYEPFNNIADAIIGDVDSIVLEINQEMLSIVGKPPHEWTSYSISFGKLMAGFIMALSFGYVSYEDYENVLKNFKRAFNEDEEITSIKFGRN